jgi:hypothetical protein
MRALYRAGRPEPQSQLNHPERAKDVQSRMKIRSSSIPLDICTILRTISVALAISVFHFLLLKIKTPTCPQCERVFMRLPAVSYQETKCLMSHYQVQPLEEEFPNEDYSALRRLTSAPCEVIIPYKPAEEPAWDRHCNSLPPKPARFKKLNRWDSQRWQISTVLKWAVLAAGTASVATPVLMRLPH